MDMWMNIQAIEWMNEWMNERMRIEAINEKKDESMKKTMKIWWINWQINAMDSGWIIESDANTKLRIKDERRTIKLKNK